MFNPFWRRKHRYGAHGDQVPPWAAVIQGQNWTIIERLEKIMATLADVTAAVARNTDAEDAALVYLKDIAQNT